MSDKAIPISSMLTRILDVAARANMPVLLKGSHGIGKSEFLLGYAQKKGLKAHVLDLSLLESTDLTGIPYIEDGHTHFAPPTILPLGDAQEPTMLVLEELNRCDRSVRQPCLQLLTTRKLNDYKLPKNCFLAACINPDGSEYQVDSLDPALASRFLTLDVKADPDAWLRWARDKQLYPGVVRFVEKFPQSFDRCPPRTWTYAAHLIESAILEGWSMGELDSVLIPLLGSVAAQALMAELPDELPKVQVAELLASPGDYQERFESWMTQSRTDIVSVVLEGVRQHLEKHDVSLDEKQKDELVGLLDLAPADLGVPILEAIGC